MLISLYVRVAHISWALRKPCFSFSVDRNILFRNILWEFNIFFFELGVFWFFKEDIAFREFHGVNLIPDRLIEVRLFAGHLKYGIVDLMQSLDNLVQDGLGMILVDLIIIIDENVCHSLRDELEGLDILLVFI